MDYLPPFHKQLLRWFTKHGRHDLPWQNASSATHNSQRQRRDPYRAWLAEIMLQQTQVKTVIPYYQRFVKRFATLRELALAEESEVLYMWAGLGYYQRARNLHKCARTLIEKYAGKFPQDLSQLQSLPGIGRSTAGAIASACFGQVAPILDGNVRRVLCRLYAIKEPPSSALEKQLWQLSEYHTCVEHPMQYNQAIMDLGAGVCTPNNPQCHACPLRVDCRALATRKVTDYPLTAKRKVLPQREIFILLIEDKTGAILLEKRPATGVWPHLWSCPEINDEAEINTCLNTLQLPEAVGTDVERLKHVLHKFTHYALTLKPLRLRLNTSCQAMRVSETDTHCWYEPEAPQTIALPQPIKKILQTSRTTHEY